LIPWLGPDDAFPDVSEALTDIHGAPGLLAAGADLSSERLLMAYREGIFPWFSEGQPILWWSTDPRMVLNTNAFRVSDSLKKTLRKIARDPAYTFRFDSAFEQVMRNCAAPRADGYGTWISPDIIRGYCGLHEAGYAHSAELWHHGELVGGAYGVCIGTMFYGESMFARERDASKIALSQLVFHLRRHGVAMIDCQQETGHLASLGAQPIPREQFIQHLKQAIQFPAIRDWTHTGIQAP
jgi:leucyl/phenylalanyl-tRNA--protein transferase